jgi:uncharacterized membrane protein YjjP (DUF1212 family)
MAGAWWHRLDAFVRQMFHHQDVHDEPVDATGRDPAVLTMLRALGAAMVQSGRATNDTDQQLDRIAHAYGRDEIRSLVMPTAIIIQLVGETTTTEIDTIETEPLRLDQIGAIDKLVVETVKGGLKPHDVLRRLDEIRESAPRFHPLVKLIGHVVLTLGFGMALDPTIAALPAYAVLGAVVGFLRFIGRPGTIVGDSLPIVAAFTVTVLTGTLLEEAVRDDAVRVITPSLVSFLPGLVLTIAAIELTHGQVIAGASRVVYGLSQLVVLAFGVVAGVAVVGDITSRASSDQLGWWAPLVGVLLTAIGYTLFSGAPKGSLPWFILVLLTVHTAQRIGSELLSPELSGFAGALVIIPLTRAIELLPRGPSSAVTMLPALWLLVPGALGFIGISEAARGDQVGSGVESLVATGLAMFSISLGVLVGSGIVRDVSKVKTTWQGTQ